MDPYEEERLAVDKALAAAELRPCKGYCLPDESRNHVSRRPTWNRITLALRPDKPKITRLTRPDNLQAIGFSLTHDGRQGAFTASSPSALSEVFVSKVKDFAPRKLTKMTEQTRSLI